MTVLSPFLEFSLNFLSNNWKKQYQIWYSPGDKRCQSLNCQKHCLKIESGIKLPVKPTWSVKMTVLSSFLESSLNFLSNNLKKQYQIWYSPGEKRCQSLNCQKHCLKIESVIKSPVKPTWSDKMTILSTFLESSLNFLFDNLQKHYQIWYSQGEKRCQSLNCQKHNKKRQSGTKSPIKPSWSEKMTVLSTFLESSLNFLFDNLKKHYQIWYSQRKKRCQNLNCQNEQSGIKSPVKCTWSEKMIVLSTFLEF